MLPNEIIRKAMSETNTTQLDLAKRLGYVTQSAISSKLKADKLDTKAFIKMLDVMGYTVNVVSKEGNITYLSVEN